MQETTFSIGPIPGLEVIRSIGRGSVAEVFLAREPALGRLVALKVVHATVAADRVGRSRFEREGLAVARVANERVVQVHRVGETADRRPFLVMEYVKGRNLQNRLEAEGLLSMEEARRVVLELAHALVLVHQQGIVHRDVRPGNVLEEEGTGRIVLTDFGLAALLESGESSPDRLTKTGQLLGDLNFITPEQLKGDPVTTQADIYQLGVLAHWLVTGRGPFGALTMDRLIGAHLQGEPNELVGAGGATDPAFAALARRCLAKDPARRPTASDIVRKLTVRSDVPEVPGIDLIRRRVPHFVIPTAGLAVVLLGLISDVIQNAGLPRSLYWVAVALSIHGVLAAAVVSWFHGARGKQKVEPLEIALLVGLSVSFLGASGWILLA
jgi:serine/threonine protein kinase